VGAYAADGDLPVVLTTTRRWISEVAGASPVAQRVEYSPGLSHSAK